MIRSFIAIGVLAAACTSPTSDPQGGADAAAGAAPDAAPLGLPLTVDDWFAPGGYMGDGEVIDAITDDEECGGTRGGDGRGLCHRFTWSPAGMGWAGVYWQHPDGNWGTLPGLDVPSGATQVSLYAWGAAGGETVSFMAGMADVDGFEVKQESVALTTTPTRYTLSLADTGYGDVVGGFGWVAADAQAEVVFFVDDIVWE